MLRDMFKKTYTKIDTRYRAPEAERTEKQEEEPGIPAGMWRKCNKCGKPIYVEDVRENFYVCPKCGGYFRVHAWRRLQMVTDPAGMWRKCNKCGKPIYVEDVRENFYVCPKCGGYFRVHAWRRLQMVTDPGTFEEWDREMEVSNPLNFPGYEKKLEAAREKSRLNEAIVTGCGRIGGNPAVIGVCDARFLMSSMGHNVGEKITRAVERSRLNEAIVTGCGRIGGNPAVIGVCDARFLMSSMGHNVGEKITRAVERATREKLPVVLFACRGPSSALPAPGSSSRPSARSCRRGSREQSFFWITALWIRSWNGRN